MTNAALRLNSATDFAGLGTADFTVTTAGPYTFSFKTTLPYIAAGTSATSATTEGGSELSVVLKLNSDTLLTVEDPAPTQKITSGTIRVAAVAGDVISAVLTSEAAVDNTLNAIKTTFNLYQGE